MKKRKLRGWVKIVVFVIGVVIGVVIGICLVKQLINAEIKQQQADLQAINYCVEQGNSEVKCIRNYYGN